MEVKCLQLIHSKKGLLVVMLPENMNMAYVEKRVQRCIIKGVDKTIDERSDSLTVKDLNKQYGDFKVLLDLAYPSSNFKHQRNGDQDKLQRAKQADECRGV